MQEQYHREVMQIACRRAGRNTITDEPTGPVQLKFCVAADWLDSNIDLGLIDDFLHNQELHDDQLKDYLELKVQENRDNVTVEALNDNIRDGWQVCMNDTNWRSSIIKLFTAYVSIIRQKVLAQVI